MVIWEFSDFPRKSVSGPQNSGSGSPDGFLAGEILLIATYGVTCCSQCRAILHLSVRISAFHYLNILVIFKQLQRLGIQNSSSWSKWLKSRQKPRDTHQQSFRYSPLQGTARCDLGWEHTGQPNQKLSELKNPRNPNHFVKMIKILKLFGHRHFFWKMKIKDQIISKSFFLSGKYRPRRMRNYYMIAKKWRNKLP